MFFVSPINMISDSAAPTTTWNSADKGNRVLLSNGDLTTTFDAGAAGYGNVRSVASASSGKKYWELSADVIASPGNTIVEGIANATAQLTGGGAYLGNDTNSIGWAGDGVVYISAGALANIQGWAQGDTLCFAADFDNSTIWFRTNGGNWNNSGTANPATNTGGISIAGMAAGPYFAAWSGTTTNDQHTANFGATSYAQAKPSGFSNW
jgi:hypothetical protein